MEAIDLSARKFLPYENPNLNIIEENELLRKEIQVARKAAEITATLVVKQFEETEKILHRFQVANAQRKAVLDSAADISIIATNRKGIIKRIILFKKIWRGNQVCTNDLIKPQRAINT